MPVLAIGQVPEFEDIVEVEAFSSEFGRVDVEVTDDLVRSQASGESVGDDIVRDGG